MEKFSLTVCCRQTKLPFFALLVLFSISLNLKAQNRKFGILYSENIKGGSALFGNTLMNAVKSNGLPDIAAMNGNSASGNSNYTNGGSTNMQYVDIDGNSGYGGATRNSSSADLVLPAGTNTIKMARLYWGGRAATAQFDMKKASNQRIKIRKGTSGAYQEYAAVQLDKFIQDPGAKDETYLYQASVDITALVQNSGGGTYTVGNAALSTGEGDTFGNYGAWSIVVVYENPLMSYNSVRIFDGYQQVYNGGGATVNSVTLTGLNVPSGTLAAGDAQLGIVAFEGDAHYGGDFFKINDHVFSNALNPANNSWNGTITSNGVHVTTKSPNYTDQMGIDIDQFNVGTGYGILPNASTVSLAFGTTQDQYFCGLISFVIKMKDPAIKLAKTVADANGSGTAEAGEVLTYKLKGKNVGAGNANEIVLTDVLPACLTYLPNSLKVNYCPGLKKGAVTDNVNDDIAEYSATDRTVTFRIGNTAGAVKGGYVAGLDSFEVEFRATVNVPTDGVIPPIVNVARLTAKSDAGIDHVDDATAAIGPLSGPLPVTLTSFSAVLLHPGLVKVLWSSSMEANCSRYDVERSTDGVNFYTVATKAGSGNSSVAQDYNTTDNIAALNTDIVYYRLSQVDIDGTTNLSKVVSIRLQTAAAGFTVSPNPFHNNVNIGIDWKKNESTTINVFDVSGAEVFSKSLQLVSGYNYIRLNELARLAPGSYIIQFTTATGKLVKQIVKEK